MGFFEPSPPPFDLEEWKAKPHLSRLKPLVQDWGANGFGSPTFVYLVYALKLVVFCVGGAVRDLADARARLALRPRRLVDAADRLREAGGLAAALGDPRARRRVDAAQLPLQPADRRRRSTGCGPGRCGCRPGRTGCRSPRGRPAPGSTSGSTRGCWPPAIFLLGASGVDRSATSRASCRRRGSRCCSACSGCSACATRSRSSGPGRRSTRTVLVVGLFPVEHWVVAWQFVFLFIWWGAASSKLNSHFPFVVSTMMSNAPLIPRAIKRRLWRDYPEDMMPSRLAAGDRALRHGAGVPLAGAAGLSGQPDDPDDRDRRDDPLPREHHLDVPARRAARVEPVHDLRDPLPVRALRGHAALDARRPAADRRARGPVPPAAAARRELRPDKVSFLPSMRYYAGQLGDQRLALPQGERGGGEARHAHQEAGADRSSSRSATSTTARRRSTCSTGGSPSGRCTPTAGR